ncbi:MAG: zinc ABC transporter substrate-binding protein [SAR324 cluster bacterium]|nr:zinc ABC transporter substrate-binding protein [SAR324 cluster bacterium]
MKKLFTLLFLFTLWATALTENALARVSIFACEPEWAALAKEIGGDQVKVFSATTGQQDPHHVQARPSLIAKLRQADLLICTGAELEAGWLPLLLRRSRNTKVQPGQQGYFLASKAVVLLEKPVLLDRSQGDVHAEGNPHLHLDPHNISLVSKDLASRLALIDPASGPEYQQRYQDFTQRWALATTKWEAQLAPWKGKKIIVHHQEWVYLTHWLGIQRVGALEPKPGVPASSNHLSKLKLIAEVQKPIAIINSPINNPRPAQWLSKQSNIPVIELPYTVGGVEEVEDLFSLFQVTANRLQAGLK